VEVQWTQLPTDAELSVESGISLWVYKKAATSHFREFMGTIVDDESEEIITFANAETSDPE
jgi:hypothetical protein